MRFCLPLVGLFILACGGTTATGPDTVRVEADDNKLDLNESTTITVTLLNSANKTFTGSFKAIVTTTLGRFDGGEQRVTVDLENNTAQIAFTCDTNGNARIAAAVDALTSSNLTITCGSGVSGTTGITGVTGVTGLSGITGVSGMSGNMNSSSLSDLTLTVERATVLTSSSTTISATVKAASGMQAPDGSVVVFMVSGGGMLSATTDTTTAGIATVDFTAPASTGTFTISASYTDSTGTTRTAAAEVVAVSVAVAVPQAPLSDTIRVKGSIGPNSVPMSFTFYDAQNNPVPEGLVVSFAIADSASDGVQVSPATTTTNEDGVASTILFAGGQAETVSITATATLGAISVVGVSTTVSIISGIPEYSHLSWGCELDSNVLEGMWIDGLETKCTLRVADRFSNSVDTGTVVNFRTEAGHVNANATVSGSGAAVATISTAEPRPTFYNVEYVAPGSRQTDPGKVTRIYGIPNNYARIPHRPFPGGNEFVAPTGSTGPLYTTSAVQRIPRITIIGITQGEETFVDTNANDIYDMGEPFIDLAEPFVDKNDNGVQDTCMVGPVITAVPFTTDDEEFFSCYEPFIDLDGNGQWDAGNGEWDNFTSIWKATHIAWVDYLTPQLYPASITDGNNDLLDDASPPAPRLNSTYGVASKTTVPLGSGGNFSPTAFNLDIIDQFLSCDLRGTKYSVSSAVVEGIEDIKVDHFGFFCRDTIVVTDTADAPRLVADPRDGILRVKVHTDADGIDWDLTWPVHIDP